jgi:hypothetical protein
MTAPRGRLARLRAADEAGLTLIELVVAATMSVVIVGAASSMLISAVKSQPKISKRAQNVSKARYVQERITREIRNGVVVKGIATDGSEIELEASVRRTACGSGAEDDPEQRAILCSITYSCSAGTCTRTEADPETEAGGPATKVVSGLAEDGVFYVEPSPSAESEEQRKEELEAANYVGVTLKLPDPEGPGELSVSDGATLRTKVLAQKAEG